MEGHLGNATPTTSWHELHWWKSPRWIVIRIEALAVVAIIFSFFLAAFGSTCRRWSNSWIVQKGFLAAQVLSLSLGTYSIGLMQSSSVKSEMYPIWTVSLFTLFGCIDPVTTYNGLDYKGALSKVVYGICLNCGYVLLMSISTISNVVGNAAIITLSAITLIKGFHRSFALVDQNRIRHMVYAKDPSHGEACIFRKDESASPDDPRYVTLFVDLDKSVNQREIELAIKNNNDKRLSSCYDVCVALGLSNKLECHFLGLDYRVPRPETLESIDYKWAMKVIEIELAFLYDAFFTGSPFLHYYQAETASLWALASLTGICFVLVAISIPGGMSSRRPGASGGCTNIVDTTTADLAVTFGILVSLALLHLMQLVRSWTSNWARVAVACAYARKDTNRALVRNFVLSRANEGITSGTDFDTLKNEHLKLSGWMKLKAFVATSTDMFDKYLWQDKISQYSMVPELRKGETKLERLFCLMKKWGRLLTGGQRKGDGTDSSKEKGGPKRKRCYVDFRMLGLHYIWKVIWELLSSDANKRGGVKLDEDVKGSITEFLGKIKSDRLDREWLSSLPEEPEIRHFLPHFSETRLLKLEEHCYRYTSCVMIWHIVTWYCELMAEQKKRQEETAAEAPIGCGWETAATASYYLRKAVAAMPQLNCFQRRRGEGGGGTKARDHRRVANALSMYCAYLVKSAPELLPGPVAWTKRVYDSFADEVKREIEAKDRDTILEKMADGIVGKDWNAKDIALNDIWDLTSKPDILLHRFPSGGALAKLLMRRSDTWEVLALVWVQLLVYAAPYGNVEEHMRRLSHGGEFITHLWALLYHLDIREWKVDLEPNNLHNISTIKDAQRTLNNDDHDPYVVAFFLDLYRKQQYHDKFVTASRPIDGVKFYLTSSPDVAKYLKFPAASVLEGIGILFLNKTNKKSTFFDSQRGRGTYDFALFVYENKIAWARERAQEAAPSTSHNPIPTENQGTEDGQTVVEIEDETREMHHVALPSSSSFSMFLGL